MMRKRRVALGGLLGLMVAVAAVALPAAARAAYAPRLNLNYDQGSPPAPSPANQNYLDLYSPLGFSGARPVVVYVHGGGWRNGDKGNQIANKRNLFTGAGYVFASLNYRLSPDPPDTSDPGRVMFPDHPHDVGEAIGWLHANVAAYGGDPERIVLIGHSAGAHLVSLLGTFPTNPAPSFLAAYGVGREQLLGVISLDSDAYDVAERIGELPAASKITYYSPFGTAGENAATSSWTLASPRAWADVSDPPFLIVTQAAVADRVADSRTMASALGQSPDDGVLAVPLDHLGINDALGDPGDLTPETPTVMAFVSSLVAASRPAKVKLRKRPAKLIRSGAKRVKVELRFSAAAGGAFECRLDKEPFKRCRSPRSFKVRRGRHTIRVRARGLVKGKLVGSPGKATKIGFRVLPPR